MGLILDESSLVDSSELFGNPQAQENTPPVKTEDGSKENLDNKDENNPDKGGKVPPAQEVKESTTEVKATAADLFGNPVEEPDKKEEGTKKPESVSGNENKDQKEPSSEGNGNSPVISSFAKALKEDGYLTGLDDDAVSKIDSARAMADAIDKEVNSRLTEKQKEIADAMSNGVPVNTLQTYNNIITNLNNITDEQVNDESDNGKNLRQSLIYQDFVNKGISPEKARSLVERSVSDGKDIEDAKTALIENQKYFKGKYDSVIKEAADKRKAEDDAIKQQAEDLKKSMIDNDELFKGIKVDKTVRQKAYDAVANPAAINKDGERLTLIQKYADDNPVEFRKMLGYVYALTDGYKDFGKLLNKEVKQKVQSHLDEFEQKLKSGSLGNQGNLHYAEGSQGRNSGGAGFGNGWKLDV